MNTRMGGVLHDHVVSFYDRDSELAAEVADFVADGLDNGERVVLLASAEHRAAIDEVLVQYGVDAGEASRSGALQSLDAATMLASCMSEAGPDPSLFAGMVGPVIEAAAAEGSRARIYGEMVAVLWARGDVAGALRLEELWNALASTHDFTLMCAYPTSVLDASLTEAHEICAAHTQVIAPRSYAVAAAELGDEDGSVAVRSSEVFLPLAAAIPAARRFVANTLRAWGEETLVGDGILIVSELATNAVRHAGSPFRISLHRVSAAIRIAIEDVGAATPKSRVATPDASGGRGVHIVEELARTWGWDPVTTGKIVWAELPAGE